MSAKSCDFCRNLDPSLMSGPCPICFPVEWEQAKATLKPSKATTRRASRRSAPRARASQPSPAPVPVPATRPVAPPPPAPVPRPTPPAPKANPWQDSDKTEIAAPVSSTCGKPVDLGLSEPVPCVLDANHGGGCSVVSAVQKLADRARQNAREPLRVVPPPAPAPVAVAWTSVHESNRPQALKMIRDAFTSGDINTGILYVCRLAARDQYDARKAELQEIDNRAQLTGMLPEDDRRRWQIFDQAKAEIGFDPRESDGPKVEAVRAYTLEDVLG